VQANVKTQTVRFPVKTFKEFAQNDPTTRYFFTSLV